MYSILLKRFDNFFGKTDECEVASKYFDRMPSYPYPLPIAI